MLVMTLTRYAPRPLVTLGLTTVENAQFFGAHAVVRPQQVISPTTVVNAASFGTHGMRKRLLAGTFANGSTFGAHALVPLAPGAQYLYPTTLANANAFGAGGKLVKKLHATALASSNSFGAAALSKLHHYSYANTGGTGNRTGSITVTTTATLGAGAIANLVNGDNTANSTHACWFSNGQSGREVKFDFGSGRIVRQARWRQDSTGTHGTWKWQGSNDNSSWADIGGTFTLGGVNGDQVHHTLINNTTAYRYYRLLQTAGTTSSGPWLREIEFFLDGATDSLGDTSYRYALGGGTSDAGATTGSGGNGVDRSGTITVTANRTNNPSNLVDGAAGNNTTDSADMQNAQTDAVITFDLGSKHCITAFAWEQNNSTGQGNWDFEGSNDNASWTGIAANFSLVNGTAFRELTFTNANAYRYYRLKQVSGSTSSSPWLHEIYFKLVPDTRA